MRGRRKGPGTHCLHMHQNFCILSSKIFRKLDTPRGLVSEFPAFTEKIEHAQTVCTRPFPPPSQKRAWVRGQSYNLKRSVVLSNCETTVAKMRLWRFSVVKSYRVLYLSQRY